MKNIKKILALLSFPNVRTIFLVVFLLLTNSQCSFSPVFIVTRDAMYTHENIYIDKNACGVWKIPEHKDIAIIQKDDGYMFASVSLDDLISNNIYDISTHTTNKGEKVIIKKINGKLYAVGVELKSFDNDSLFSNASRAIPLQKGRDNISMIAQVTYKDNTLFFNEIDIDTLKIFFPIERPFYWNFFAFISRLFSINNRYSIEYGWIIGQANNGSQFYQFLVCNKDDNFLKFISIDESKIVKSKPALTLTNKISLDNYNIIIKTKSEEKKLKEEEEKRKSEEIKRAEEEALEKLKSYNSKKRQVDTGDYCAYRPSWGIGPFYAGKEKIACLQNPEKLADAGYSVKGFLEYVSKNWQSMKGGCWGFKGARWFIEKANDDSIMISVFCDKEYKQDLYFRIFERGGEQYIELQ